ncbi:MAG: ABC transporter ATP-binding protein [Oscillospiraceae bacterium]|nr:ABC transporter ATP-binding protein [Oscillospiraceae bacterium]
MSDVILDIKNVYKSYGDNDVLKNVSFSVRQNRIVGLLGPNGSGKTTLIKIISGLLSDYSGRAEICGMAPCVETKALVSYLPDRMSLPEWMTVKMAIRLFADFFADFDTERAREMLGTLGVSPDKRIGQLSKGMKEKLQLCLCMSRRAKLYVLDEPIAGVDPAARDVIMSTILGNFGEGSSILLSTHIISDVEQIFDDVILLREGRVELMGDAEELRREHGKSIDQLFRGVFKC